jgi:hypothetical protein
MTEQTSFKGLIPPPKTATGLYEWMNKAYIQFNNMLSGKLSATYPSFTLAAGAAQTTLTDYRIGGSTVILFVPKTANAAAEIGNGTLILGEPVDGAVNIGHANNAQTDRTFDLVLIG